MEEQAKLAQLRAEASTLDLATLRPAGFLDKVSMKHNEIFRPRRATIYDKVTALTLLFYQDRVLLLVCDPASHPQGWKPPSRTYNANDMGENLGPLGNCSITGLSEKSITETLSLHMDCVHENTAPAIHSPRFGARRLPDNLDSWLVAHMYEMWPTTGLPSWPVDPRKVFAVHWFTEQEVADSKEIDGVTKAILLEAFPARRRAEEEVQKTLESLF